MSYYLAPSLVALRNEVNAKFPKRDKTSDGWIGDPSHAARASDHNPDYAHGGVVRAVDIDIDDNDPALDLRAELIAAAQKHPATYYWISNGMIWSRSKGLRPYTGVNGHFKHVHISILPTDAAENSTVKWLAPKVVVVVKTKVQEARAHLRKAKALLKEAGKSRPAAERAKRRTRKTLKNLPKK